MTEHPASKQLRQAADALRSHFPAWDAPRALIQLGMGFEAGALFDEDFGTVSMVDVGMTSERPSPCGSPLTLTLGTVGQAQVLLANGHRYRYEHPDITQCVTPTVVAALTGITDIILLEPGFSLREDLKPGTWIAATDYIDRMATSPAACLLDMVDNPFIDMTDAFSQSLNSEVINATARTGITPRLGIYQATPGPHFDTPAEAAAARQNGADVIGNAVVPETVSAALLGCRVTALILVAEAAASYHARKLDVKDVIDAARFCSQDIMRGLRRLFHDPEAEAERPVEHIVSTVGPVLPERRN